MATGELSFGPSSKALTHEDKAVKVTKVIGPDGFKAMVYRTKIGRDWDGAPNAYGLNRPGSPLQQNINAKDYIGNASNVKNSVYHHNNFAWVGLYAAERHFADQNGLIIDDRPFLEAKLGGHGQKGYPVVQSSLSVCPGYYVSTTSMVMHYGVEPWQVSRYVDASWYPYGVLSKTLLSPFLGEMLKPGDVGLAIANETGLASGFFFADYGPRGHIGEMSAALGSAIFPPNGNTNKDVSFIVFPGSGTGIALTKEQCDRKVQLQIAKLSNAWNTLQLALLMAVPEKYFPKKGDTLVPESAVLRGMSSATYDKYARLDAALKLYGWVRPPLQR